MNSWNGEKCKTRLPHHPFTQNTHTTHIIYEVFAGNFSLFPTPPRYFRPFIFPFRLLSIFVYILSFSLQCVCVCVCVFQMHRAYFHFCVLVHFIFGCNLNVCVVWCLIVGWMHVWIVLRSTIVLTEKQMICWIKHVCIHTHRAPCTTYPTGILYR